MAKHAKRKNDGGGLAVMEIDVTAPPETAVESAEKKAPTTWEALGLKDPDAVRPLIEGYVRFDKETRLWAICNVNGTILERHTKLVMFDVEFLVSYRSDCKTKVSSCGADSSFKGCYEGVARGKIAVGSPKTRPTGVAEGYIEFHRGLGAYDPDWPREYVGGFRSGHGWVSKADYVVMDTGHPHYVEAYGITHCLQPTITVKD